MIVHLGERVKLKKANMKVPLEVSTVGLRVAAPLRLTGCTMFLSRLDGEVRIPHVFLRSPNMRNKIQASISNQQ